MTLLQKRDKCPIHGSYFCCGRSTNRVERKHVGRSITEEMNERRKRGKEKWQQLAPGVWSIPDEHHPRGYRERRSPAAMRALVRDKVSEQHGICPLCREPLTDMREVDGDHISPRGMGGAFRDDSPENIQAVHRACNYLKGSKRVKGAM